MDTKKNEIRTIPCQLSIREAEGATPGESRTIAGTAIVFNCESEVLDDWDYRFRETILPEACTADFLATQDIKLNLLHDRSMTLARSNKGAGNMRLYVDEKGVNFEFEAPKCDIGDRCLELVRAGVYSGCSFEFYPGEYDVIEYAGGREIKITHKRFEAVTALTIGMDPAYKQTSVNAREMAGQTPSAKAEAAAREAFRSKESEMRRREIDRMRRACDLADFGE